MSVFVTGDMFELVVKYVERKLASGLETVMLITTEEHEQRYSGTIKEMRTMWVQPNWKEHTEVIRRATKMDQETGVRDIDWPLYRSLVLETFMKKWDVKEGDKSVPCTAENINRLEPVIANQLSNMFIARTTTTEQELGN